MLNWTTAQGKWCTGRLHPNLHVCIRHLSASHPNKWSSVMWRPAPAWTLHCTSTLPLQWFGWFVYCVMNECSLLQCTSLIREAPSSSFKHFHVCSNVTRANVVMGHLSRNLTGQRGNRIKLLAWEINFLDSSDAGKDLWVQLCKSKTNSPSESGLCVWLFGCAEEHRTLINIHFPQCPSIFNYDRCVVILILS